MKIVPYNQKYRSEIIKVWNRTLVMNLISNQSFIKKILLDENFNPTYCPVALNEKNEVVGFVWSAVRRVSYGNKGLEPERGWIATVFVDPRYQRQGIGTKLIKEIEKKMRTHGVTNITLGAYSPNYIFPGVDEQNYPAAKEFFEQLGYVKYGEAVSMERSLLDFIKTPEYLNLTEKILEKGYQLSAFTLEDTEELLLFIQSHFQGGWANHVRNAILNDTANDTILILKDKNDDIVGYAQRAIDGNPNRFGPFGVMKELRGEGLGTILFNEMLFSMLGKGISHAYFLWTGGNNIDFYERNGMNVYRKYHLMYKNIL
ncbi:MAG TPA: GNAT family N-acetyltransferase [Atopostipes sp.]|nr:GNAT family N-acetyltransferase [Atopostipes sp.]